MIEKWDLEPNRIEFYSNGFLCLIIRHESMKHLCGFIAVPEGHRFYGVDWGLIDLSVHGGITSSFPGTPESYKEDIYYKPEFDSLGNKLWYIGFDCGHVGDLQPTNYLMFKDTPLDNSEYEIYRDIDFVRGHLFNLSNQLLQLS